MIEEIVARIEQMEKSQQEFREILARDREKHREQMAQMMQVIMRMVWEKGTSDDAGSMNIATRTQRVTEGLAYPLTSFVMPKVELLIT